MMEPTDIYQSIQPLVKQDVSKMINDVLIKGQYDVSDVQAHTHNGIDSLQVPFGNLADAQYYSVIQRSVLSTAQIKALNTTPIILVPAPVPSGQSPSGRILKIFNIVTGIAAFINYSGTAYTGANALEFRYTDGSGAKVTADISTTFLNAAANSFSWVAGVTTELVPVANAPVVVRVPTANPATGNSPITFVVTYKVVSF